MSITRCTEINQQYQVMTIRWMKLFLDIGVIKLITSFLNQQSSQMRESKTMLRTLVGSM